jgi:glycosyltransferase involved in cell wall biosynthesis
VHVSLIIPTHNKVHLLRRTLSSLENQSIPREDFEVLVIDDGSTDGTAEYLAAYAGPLRVLAVRHPSNRGRAAARNAGLKAATGDLIVFLDDDMEVVPDFLKAHLALHAARPGRVGVGNVVNAPEVTDSPIVRYMSTRGAQKIQGRGPLPWKYFSTNNSSVPRLHLEKIGLFDEDFVTYGFEDLELGYRLHRDLNLEFVFVEKARSSHIHYHDLDDVLGKKYLSGRSSLAIMFRKHPETRAMLRFHRYQPPAKTDSPGLIARKVFYRSLLVPPIYRLVKPLARFDWGWISDRIFDYLVLYQTLRGLAEAESASPDSFFQRPVEGRS